MRDIVGDPDFLMQSIHYRDKIWITMCFNLNLHISRGTNQFQSYTRGHCRRRLRRRRRRRHHVCYCC